MIESETMKNILVLAGHLDDAVIAIGGTIRSLVNQGCKVSVVCFGNGDEAFTDISKKDEAVGKFKKEAEEAHQVLGVDYFECFDVPDFAVQRNRETYRQCIKAIRQHQPDVILGHYWREYFQHHDMAKLACDSWWQSAWDCSADLGKPWKAHKMYHFEVIHDLPDPTHYVDISETFENKVEAWKKFKSAEEHLGQMAEQMETRARHHGSKIDVKYAEVLKQSFFVPQEIKNPAKEL